MSDFHVINRDNKYIVFHPDSLSLFSVNENIGKILEHHELQPVKSNPKIDNAKLLKYLSDRIKVNTSKDLKWKTKEPKTLCLFISQDCNLRCSYCFADHGAFGGMEKLMNIDTAKKSMDKILGKTFNNYIVFFGGEPFLNISLMNQIEEYGRQVGLEIKYMAVTNGTIMNDAIERFVTEKLLYLCVSLDGPKDINDIQRYGSLESVHDKALMTINRLKSKNVPLSIKCTATKNSVNKLTYISEYLNTLGVNTIAFAPVARIPSESELFISEKEFEIYAKELACILVANLNQLAVGNAITAITPLFHILSQFVTKTRMIHHCSAGREYLAVTADGDVYPCHEFVGMEDFKMGNVNDEDFPGEAYNRIKKLFNNHSIYAFEECKSCWARFLCGGDCAVRSYIYNGDLFRPTKRKCILIKSILEALLPEIAEIFQDKNKRQNIIKLFKEYEESNNHKNPLLE